MSKPVTNPRRADSRWYVASIMNRLERVSTADGEFIAWQPAVVPRLIRLGFGVYLPMGRTEVQHRRTKKWTTVAKPVVPGYVFLDMPADRPINWKSLLDCFDVIDVLREGDEPFPILSHFVERLIAAQQDMQFDDTRDAKRHRKEIGKTERETTEMLFPVGAPVMVTAGPFRSFDATVTGVRSANVVEACLSIFGRMTPVQFELGQIRKIAA